MPQSMKKLDGPIWCAASKLMWIALTLERTSRGDIVMMSARCRLLRGSTDGRMPIPARGVGPEAKRRAGPEAGIFHGWVEAEGESRECRFDRRGATAAWASPEP